MDAEQAWAYLYRSAPRPGAPSREVSRNDAIPQP